LAAHGEDGVDVDVDDGGTFGRGVLGLEEKWEGE
jgi:hypothetical protein